MGRKRKKSEEWKGQLGGEGKGLYCLNSKNHSVSNHSFKKNFMTLVA